ncbi:unnamed protein product, partial [Rotaria sp. Silwood2]
MFVVETFAVLDLGFSINAHRLLQHKD